MANPSKSPVVSNPDTISVSKKSPIPVSKKKAIGFLRRKKKTKLYHKHMRKKTGKPGTPPKTNLPFDAVENVTSDPDLADSEDMLLFDVMYDIASKMLGRPATPVTKTVHDVTYLCFI